MAQLSFVIYSEIENVGSELREALTHIGHAEVVATVTTRDELVPALRTFRPDMLFAHLGSEPEAVLDLVERIPAPRPALLLAGADDDRELILRAMRMGARGFFASSPPPELLRDTVERLMLEYQPVAAVEQRAPVLAVMGAKGGVGATVIACQLATSLQHLGAKTAIVDLNLPLGDVAFSFDLQPTYTLAQLASEAEGLDATYLHSLLQPHSSGVQVLAAPTRLEEGELVQGHHLESVLALLRRDFEWIVLDVSRSWNELSVRALDLADMILLVTTPEVTSLHHTHRQLDLLKRLGHRASSVRLIVNRTSKSQQVGERDLSKCLGREPDICVPNDNETVSSCVSQGKAMYDIAPRSAVQSALAELANQVHPWCEIEPPERPEPPEPQRRSLLPHLFRRQ